MAHFSRSCRALSLAACLTAAASAQSGMSLLATWPCGAAPAAAVDLFGVTVFTTKDELWRSDGTAAGTYRLLSAWLPDRNVLVRMGDHVYFTSFEPATGEELWCTDGTPAGTHIVHDYLPGGTSTLPRSLTPLGRYLVFTGQTPPSGGFEPYVSDGTPLGTGQLLDLNPGAAGSNPAHLVALGDRVLFVADDGVHGNEFWVTDGTAAGTHLVTDFVPGPGGLAVQLVGNAGGRAWFTRGSHSNVELIVSDGTAAGTRQVYAWQAQLESYNPLAHFTEVAGRIWFCVQYYNGNNATSVELWSTDGTAAGTMAGGLLWPSAYRPGSPVPRLWSLGTRLLCERETQAEGVEPWIFDPATNAFTLVHDFTPGPGSSRIAEVVVLAPDRAVLTFSPPATTVTDLWRFDPTGASPAVPLRPRAAWLMPVGTRHVWFSGEDGANGYELWRTDGTPAGTQRVGGEVFPGASGLLISGHAVSGGKVLVFGDERRGTGGVCKPHLWAFDPGAHTHPLGVRGAAGTGAAHLAGDDPVLGVTANLRTAGMGQLPAVAVLLDLPHPRPLWLGSVWYYSGGTAPLLLQAGANTPDPWLVPLAVPPVPALAGLQLVAQTFGSDGSELRASNGLLLVVGN